MMHSWIALNTKKSTFFPAGQESGTRELRGVHNACTPTRVNNAHRHRAAPPRRNRATHSSFGQLPGAGRASYVSLREWTRYDTTTRVTKKPKMTHCIHMQCVTLGKNVEHDAFMDRAQHQKKNIFSPRGRNQPIAWAYQRLHPTTCKQCPSAPRSSTTT